MAAGLHCNTIKLHSTFMYQCPRLRKREFIPSRWMGPLRAGLQLSEPERLRLVYTQGFLSLKNLWKNPLHWPDSQNVHIHIKCNVFNGKPPRLRNKMSVSL